MRNIKAGNWLRLGLVAGLVLGTAGWTTFRTIGAEDSIEAEVRVWTDARSGRTVEAELLTFKDNKVQLRRKDGREVSVPLAQLSEADQKYVREELKRRRSAGSGETKKAPAGKDQASSGKDAGEWSQWRGPARDGISPETGLLKSWPAEGPPLAWKATGIGDGFSSVVVAHGRIYTMGKQGGASYLFALKEEDGSILWKAKVADGDDAPNCTPTVDQDLVIGLGFKGELVCVNAASGEELWRKNFGKDFGGRMMSGWGYSESPLFDGERVICTPGGDAAMLAALDKRTGNVVWRTAMPPGGQAGGDGAAYSSIVISNGGGVKQYVQLVGRGVIGVSAKDGTLLWGYNRIANGTANIPTPLVKGDLVFCSTGYQTGAALLKLSPAGSGKVRAEEVYFLDSKTMQNHHGGMLLVGDHVYCGHGHNEGFPLCLNLATGREAWRPGRGAGSGSAAVAYADGHLYFRYQNGTMALIEATPQEYRLKGKFELGSRLRESWPHPVIAHGKLYARDQDVLLCYDVRESR
ncbi:MAG: PQQ-binding-like beta-propeller repeat protein [Pirellulales bacterium]